MARQALKAKAKSVTHQLDEAAAHCLHLGLRLTSQRRQVLSLMVREAKPLKAYDILRLMSTRAHSAKPPTVYRALEFLLQAGLIHRVEARDAYMACGHPKHEHVSQLLVCSDCGDVQEAHEKSIEEAVRLLALRSVFLQTPSAIEIQGRCARCAA